MASASSQLSTTTMQLISGSGITVSNGNTIVNTATVLDGIHNGSGTVKVVGEGITSLTFNVSVWGTFINGSYSPDTSQTNYGSQSLFDDVFGIGVTVFEAAPEAANDATTIAASVIDATEICGVDNVTVNEGSPWAMFTVGAFEGQTISNLVLSQLTGDTGTVGIDTGVLQYYNGISWVDYHVGDVITVPSDGDATGYEPTSLKVRVAIVNDTPLEVSETLTLTVTYGFGDVDTGVLTILDNGQGNMYSNSNTSGVPDMPDTNGLPALPNDDRPLSVNSVTVNEASPYMVFEVTGVVGQYISLDLASDATGAYPADLTGGAADVQNAGINVPLQCYNGTSWVDYIPGSLVVIPAGNGKMLVRTGVVNDTPYEGAETLLLVAKNEDATVAGRITAAYTTNGMSDVAVGVGTILDDNSGNIYPDNTSGTTDPTASNNDDRPCFSVNDVTVNEAVGSMTFTITRTGDPMLVTSVDYATSNGSAVSVDYTSTSGTLNFASGVTTMTVTVPIANDNIYEIAETLNLNLSNATNGALIIDALGVGTITDATGLPTVTVSPVTVLEPSDIFAVQTVTLSNPSVLPITFNPSLVNAGNGATFATVATDTQNTPSGASIEYFDGLNWVSAANGVTIAAGQTSVQLRSAIHTNDGVTELTETYNLQTGTLTVGTATIASVTGTVTIVDNPNMSISSVVVNEASPYAVVEVTLSTPASTAINFTPSLTNGSGIAAVDTGTIIEYFDTANNIWSTAATWDGTAWVAVNGGVTIPIGASGILLRTSIVNDDLNEVSETVDIVTGITTNVLNTSGVTGTITIMDQGTNATPSNNNIFTAGNNTATPDNLTPTTENVVDPLNVPTGKVLLDDDRPVTVNNITVNEGSPFAVFTVMAMEGQYLRLELAAGATNGAQLADYSSTLEYWNGNNWTVYTNGSYVQVPGDGDNIAAETAELLVRVAIINDTQSDNAETIKLTAYNTAGVANVVDANGDTGICTIYDDGTGVILMVDDPSTQADESAPVNGFVLQTTPAIGAVVDLVSLPVGSVLLDDNRSLSVNNVSVLESSKYAEFTVTGAVNQYVKLSLADDTAKVDADGVPLRDGSEDYGPGLEYFDGMTWQTYTPGSFVKIPNGGTTLQVRTTIVNDVRDENVEIFKLIATNTGGDSAIGEGTIRDDDAVLTNIVQNVDFNRSGFESRLLTQQTSLLVADALRSNENRSRADVEDLQFTEFNWPSMSLGGNYSFQPFWSETNSEVMLVDLALDSDSLYGQTFGVPSEALIKLDTHSGLHFEAAQTNGQPLPDWMDFNSETGMVTVKGNMPDNPDVTRIMIDAIDSNGNRVTMTIFIKPKASDKQNYIDRINPKLTNIQRGKPALSEQIKVSGNQYLKQKADDLLNAFAQTFGI